MPNFMDMLKESSMRHWSITGRERLVKVVSPSSQAYIMKKGTVKGYVTQEKFLFGKTSVQIETALGLRPFELGSYCYVYALARVPRPDEVEFKLTCAFPDGKVFEKESFDQAMVARDNFLNAKDLFDRSYTPVTNYYPPGSPNVLQWKILEDIPLGNRIATVTDTIPLHRR